MSSSSAKTDEAVRTLIRLLRNRGIAIRREPLIAGSSFRVKSGSCSLQGEKIYFVDKRLSASAQLSLLVDFSLSQELNFTDSELELLPKSAQNELRPNAKSKNANSQKANSQDKAEKVIAQKKTDPVKTNPPQTRPPKIQIKEEPVSLTG